MDAWFGRTQEQSGQTSAGMRDGACTTSGRRLSSLLPGIDQTHPTTFEVQCISGREGRAVRLHDCSNLRIEYRDWPTTQATAGGNARNLSRRQWIEDQNPLGKESGKHPSQQSPTMQRGASRAVGF